MQRVAMLLVLAAVGAAAVDLAAQRRGGTAAPALRRETPKTVCPAVAGVGVNTKRRYCDVRIAEIVEDGIRIEIPARTGAAMLQFDLHNRFTAGRTIQPSRQDALVALVSPDGKIVERAAVLAELRTAKDLFDRLAAPSGRGSVATAPGPPQRVRASIPAGMAFVSLVGLRQDVQLPNGAHKYDNAGRPIALASNFEISYTPARR